MLHVFVDTNIFLSLYAFTDDNIEELKKLIALIKQGELKIYISTMVNQEFHRNRDKKIQESLGNFEKFSTSLSIPRFMEHHGEVKELQSLLKESREKHASLIEKSKAEIANLNLAADKLFLELTEAATLIAISEEMDACARRRLDRGNPPGKDGSLGDRLNWEMLLSEVPANEDLHILSRDKDFSSPWGSDVPNSFLSMEWKARKNATLSLYPGLRSFVKKHYPAIELAADIEKKFAIKSLVESTSWQKTHAAISKLAPLITDFSKEEANEIFRALLENSEIRSIIKDDYVYSFYQDLLVDHWDALDREDYEKVTELVQDPIPF
jgi:predicted nucleic acid-binding protein